MQENTIVPNMLNICGTVTLHIRCVAFVMTEYLWIDYSPVMS